MAAVCEIFEDGQTIPDPACGSGRMLPGAGKMNRHFKLYGADIDSTCCKMALINMLLNSLKGEIAHVNNLNNEFYAGFKFNTTLIDGYYMLNYTEFITPELSYIWLKPKQKVEVKSAFTSPFEQVSSTSPINGVQGCLL